MVSTLFYVLVCVPSSTYSIRDDIVGITHVTLFCCTLFYYTGRSDEYIWRGGFIPPFRFLWCFLFFRKERRYYSFSGEGNIFFKKNSFPRSTWLFFLFFVPSFIFNDLFSIITSHHAKSKSLAKHYTLTATTTVCAPIIKIGSSFEKVLSSLHSCDGVYSSLSAPWEPVPFLGTNYVELVWDNCFSSSMGYNPRGDIRGKTGRR